MSCLTGTGSQAALLSKFEDYKKYDRVNPFTVEEYYFLRNNMPSVPEEKPVRKSLKNLESIKSLGTNRLSDSKHMRESMRQFALDNDVIHVTIDR